MHTFMDLDINKDNGIYFQKCFPQTISQRMHVPRKKKKYEKFPSRPPHIRIYMCM